MNEYYIYGSTSEGELVPLEHGMTTMCIQHVVDEFVKKHPLVVHISIDIALDQTHLTVTREHGRN